MSNAIRRRPWAPALVLTLILLAGCGGGTEDTQAASSPSQPGPESEDAARSSEGQDSASDEATAEPVAGGTPTLTSDDQDVQALLDQSLDELEAESPTLTRIKEQGLLRVGIAISAVGLQQNPDTNEYFGPYVTLMETLADELGVEHEIIDIGWENIVAGLQAEQFDIAATGLTASAERLEVIDIVDFNVVGICWAVLDDREDLQSIEDLDDPAVTIGTLTGTGAEQVIQRQYPEATIDSVPGAPGQNERIQDLLAGRVDVTGVDSPTAPLWEEALPQIRFFPGEDGEACRAAPDAGTPVGFGIRKGDPALAAWLTKIFTERWDEIHDELATFAEEVFEIRA